VSENAIEAQIALHHAVNCDPKRIAQVASNLVANALKHGAPDQPIRVLASTNEQRVSSWRSRTRVSRSTQLSCDSSFSRFFAVARRTQVSV
jgi:signal transduction histidine kinase